MKFLSIFGIGDWEIRCWGKNHARKFISSNQRKIVINRNRRWKGGKNYDFLNQIKDCLREITLIDFSENVDITVLESLSLEKMTIEVGIRCRWPRTFPDTLKEININLQKHTPDITDLPRLEKFQFGVHAVGSICQALNLQH